MKPKVVKTGNVLAVSDNEAMAFAVSSAKTLNLEPSNRRTSNDGGTQGEVTGYTADQLRHWADCMDNAELPKPGMVNPESAPDLLKALLTYGGCEGGFCSCPLDNPTAPDEAHSTQCQQARAAIAKAQGGAK